MMEIKKYVQREGQRIFVDIARSGCGSGCRYCYVNTAKDRQILLAEDEIEEICTCLSKMEDLSKCFLSFCPNTEPLKSKESCSKVLKIIKAVARSGSVVQISTKERIETDFISELSKLALRKDQVFFNISLPYLTGLDHIEPGAQNLEERLENFKKVANYDWAVSCLYIKPFNRLVAKDYAKYVNLVRDYKPDFVCVGAAFDHGCRQIQPCRTCYHPLEASKLMSGNQIQQMKGFAKRIWQDTGGEVVYSTECSISRALGIPCSIRFYRYDAEMCEGCHGRKEGRDERY